MIFNASNSEDNDFEEGSSLATKTADPIVKKPSLYRVILLNDNYTPMEFVVHVLQNFFGLDKEKATQIMLAVHTKGRSLWYFYQRGCRNKINASKQFFSAKRASINE